MRLARNSVLLARRLTERYTSSCRANRLTLTLSRPALSYRNYTGGPMDPRASKERASLGPFTIASGLVFLCTAGGLVYYLQKEKERVARKRKAEHNKAVGKAKVGAPFTLIDHNGKEVSSADFLGKFMLIYFGFTRCPDICPEELDKMASVIDIVNRKGLVMQPIFITCDPARDTPQQIKDYVLDFHPSIIGFTGTYDQIKATCKAFRVYFSTPPNMKPGEDYLVDHSIFFYLMDPEGNFVDAFGRQMTMEDTAAKISAYIGDW